MSVSAIKDLRFWLLAAAFAAVVAALVMPRITLERDIYDVLAVIDITSSMNTRDVNVAGTAESRLDATKAALHQVLSGLPCQSRMGLAIFTERQTFLLLDPVEVCRDFAALEQSISELNWRMAWEGNSYVAKGLFDAIEKAGSLDAGLIFFSDGHEAPPLPFSGIPPFVGEPGAVGGLIVGVGGSQMTPLTRYDDEGREAGTYGAQDLPQENRAGPPPPDAESRPGYHPKWAPFGNEVVNNNEHMAFLREPHLQKLSQITGLSYVHLSPGQTLVPALERAVKPRTVSVASDVRHYPAGLALLILAVLYGLLPFIDAVWTRQARGPVASSRS